MPSGAGIQNFGALQPGANPSGTSVAVPGGPTAATSPTVGGSTNPFLPAFPAGQSTFAANQPNGGGVPSVGFPGFTPPGGSSSSISQSDIINNLHDNGLSWAAASSLGDAFGSDQGILQSLSQFIKGGAGFNQQAVNALIAALQPQVSRGEANIMEQMGSKGLGSGSASAIGLGDYLSQVNLNEGQIEAQMYEQSIQSYLQATGQMAGINNQILNSPIGQQQQAPGIWSMLAPLVGAAASLIPGVGKFLGPLIGATGGIGGHGGGGGGMVPNFPSVGGGNNGSVISQPDANAVNRLPGGAFAPSANIGASPDLQSILTNASTPIPTFGMDTGSFLGI